MLHQFQEHLSKIFPFLKGKKILVACSGGLDSVVLSYMFHQSGFEIILAHCNFSLRAEESDGDEKFVVSLSKKWKMPVYTQTFDTTGYAKENQLSIQMAARQLRYNWFLELSEILDIEHITTAHHLDDDLETFLINTTRGTGLKGLTGIPEINGKIIRPLLPFSREEILHYANENGITWREDSSNASTKYLRNKIRLEVIPKLKEENVQILQNFKNTRNHLKDSQALIEDYMGLVYKLAIEEITDGYSINIEKLKSLPNTKALVYELLHPFNFKEWGDVYHLLEAQSGKQVISETHVLLKDREYLYLKSREASEKEKNTIFLIPEGTKAIKEPIPLTFEKFKEISDTDSNTIFVDAGKLEFPLVLRKWEEGDVFYPFGMQGKKKLSKFFKDEKLSLFSKEKIWLLCSNKQIVWVIGLRADNRFKITPQTTQLVKINCQL